MRVAFASDLHVDHTPSLVDLIARRLEALQPDVFILAGDISEHLDRIEATLRALRPCVGRGLYVPGNHDLWVDRTGGPSSRQRYEEVLGERCVAAGFDYLPAGPVREGGISFVGQTGWFDFSLRNPFWDHRISREMYRSKRFGALRWNDGARIVWPELGRPLDDESLALWMTERLRRDLTRVGPEPVVVTTHLLPLAELVFLRGQLPWDFINGFMGSRALGDAILAHPRVVRILAGHTHTRRRAIVRGVAGQRIIAEVSPIGYPREFGGPAAARVLHRVSTFMI